MRAIGTAAAEEGLAAEARYPKTVLYEAFDVASTSEALLVTLGALALDAERPFSTKELQDKIDTMQKDDSGHSHADTSNMPYDRLPDDLNLLARIDMVTRYRTRTGDTRIHRYAGNAFACEIGLAAIGAIAPREAGMPLHSLMGQPPIYNRGRIPSRNALFEALLTSPNGQATRAKLKKLSGYSTQFITRAMDTLQEIGVIEMETAMRNSIQNSYRIADAYVPQIKELVETRERFATDTSFRGVAAKQAKQILTNPFDVARLLARAHDKPMPAKSTKKADPVETVNYPKNWSDFANCRPYKNEEEESELFFPAGTKGPSLIQAEEAKQICDGCPVRLACLATALQHARRYGSIPGIWAGLTEQDIRLIPLHERKRIMDSVCIGKPPAEVLPKQG